MISPGTIRAASLISKGMSPEAAFREANKIDVYTESRRSFLNSNPSTTINTPSLETPSALPSTIPIGSQQTAPQLPVPKKGFSLGDVSSVMSDATIKPSKSFTKNEVDAINKIASSVQNPKTQRQMSLLNPSALTDTKATSEALNKLSPKQLGELQVNLSSTLLQAKIDSLPSNISKANYVPDEYKGTNYGNALVTKLDKLYIDYNEGLLESPTVASMMQKDHKTKLSSYQKIANNFVQAKDFKSLKTAYEALEKELNFIDETASKELEYTNRLYKSGKGSIGERAFALNAPVSLEKHREKKEALRQEIGTVYNNRANAMLAKEAVGIIKNRYQEALIQNPSLDKNKFFEDITKQYNLEKSAFGIGQILVENGYFNNYQDYIRFTNPHKYSKKFTKDDPETSRMPQGEWGEIPSYLKKPEDVSSWALEYSKASPKESVVSKDYRFRDTKTDLLFTGIQFAGRISEELYQESIDRIKERETLTLNYNKKSALGTLTKQDRDKYTEEISRLNKEIDYSDAFDKAIPSIYNYENIKKNAVYKNFAIDDAEFLEKTNKWNKIYNGPETNWYDDAASSYYTQNFSNTQLGVLTQQSVGLVIKAGVSAIAEGTKFVDQTVLNKWLGVPQSSDFNKRNAIYNAYKRDLDVPELIDERASILAGRPVSASEFFWKEKGSAWYDVNFNPRAIITGAAETLPQLMMFGAAGKGIQSVAGSVAQAGLRSGTTSALLGQKTASQFAAALQKTGSTADAWSFTLKNSNNFFLKGMADKVPYGLGVATVVYPETYNRNLERLEAMGVKDADIIARNISIPSTLIEVLSESIVPNIGYVDNFAEKGTGLKKLLEKTALKKWVGSVDQYRSLYSGVLGNKFSEKTINYLARNSAEMFGQVGAATRFYASRGFEEGMEEVFSEITNGVLDNYTSFGAYKREEVRPLTIEGVLNAFAGGFFVPTAGGGAQMKAYRNNKKYGAMYDMMVNADYYRNHINQQFKEGSLTEEQASDALNKLQQLTAISDEYGVQNLKKKGSAAEFTSDLVNSPEKQFDYFKQILTVKGIEDKLAKEGTDLKEDERKTLLVEAEEATKRIDKYRRQASYFENLSEEQKDEIVANTIKEKNRKAKFETPSQILGESVVNADNRLAEAIKNREPEKRIQALRDYRNSLIEINEARAQQKQQAIANNTYNPVIAAVETEGEATPLDLADVKNYEDLVDVVTQVLVNPDKGAELDSYMRGRTNQELADLEVDRENALDNFLDHLEQTQTEPNEANQKKGQDTTADTPVERVKYKTISDLNDSQREMFEDFVEELDEEYNKKKAEVDKYDSIMDQLSSHGALQLQLSLQQQENFYNEVYKKFAAVKKIGFKTNQDKGSELFDLQDFGLYLGRNQKQIEKEIADIDAAVKAQEDTEKVEREEVSLEGLGEVAVEVPELVPTDITDAFTANLAALENIIEQQQVEVVENQITGETELLTDLPRERSRVINALVEEIAKNPDIKGAQAMMAAVMQTLGKSNEEIAKTLSQMEEIAENKPVNESDYTHMFNLYQLARMTENVPASTEAIENAAEDLGAVETSSVTEQSADAIADIERRRQEELKPYDERDAKSLEALTPNNPNHPTIKVGMKKIYGLNVTVEKTNTDNWNGEGEGYTIITAVKSPAEFDSTGKMTKAAKIEEAIFNSKEEAEAAVQATFEKVKSLAGKKQKEINAKYDAKLAALGQPVVEVIPAPVVTPPVTENQKDELADKTQISSTTPIFRPTSKKDSVDLFHYEIQEAIITNLNKEVGDKKEVNTAIVDLFTVIEETLGEQTLSALETIFNQAISPAVSKERLSELRSEFMSIFPNGFLKQSALYYMFDQIIVNKAAQSDVTEKGKEKLDATDEELISLNRNRQVSIQMADGRKFPKVKVVSKEGSLLYAVDGGKEDGSTLWLKVDRTKDKVIGLKYPILGTRPIQFTDLNALMFTVLDKDGKVQKYSNDGNRNENADKVLGLYLPTAKYKANPTDTQKQFNGLRQRIVSGDRVKISTPVKAMSISTGILTIEQPNGSTITRNKDYSFEFSTENLSVREQGPSEAAQLAQAKEVKATSQAVTPTQQTTITAVEKMIADSKQIPDPSKQGYLINGKRYERQSNFVKRALGDTSIVTEDSIVNMEMGAAVGNLLDIIGRDVLGGNKVKSLDAYIKEAEGMGKSLRSGKGYKINFTQEQFKQLVDELTEVKNELNEQGWKLFTEGLIVHREFTEKEKQETGSEGVAGAMDILAVDPEGKVHIIDFKNKKYRTQDKFTSTLYSSKQGYPSNVSKWSIQQTTYAILGEDFGLPVDSINILAFASEYAEANGVVTIGGLTLASKKAEVLDKHKSPYSSNLIRLGYDPKIIKHIELRTQKPSKKAAQVTPAVVPTTPVTPAIPKQLDLLTDQPRLTPEQVAERKAEEARQREIEFQEAMEIEELYMEYMAEKEAFELLDLPPEGEALEEMRVTRDSFVQFADKANLQGKEGKAIILAYIGKRGQGFGLDIAAQRASDIAGREITPQDLVDFILKYPSGIGTLNSKTSDTYYGFNNPDNNPKYSSISKLIAERAKDAKRLAKQKGIKDLRENLPQIPTENAENVFDVLNLFGVDINSLGIVLPDEGSTDPDALNPPPCQ